MNSTPVSGIAERLRIWRKGTLAMTQQELAEATGLHVSSIRKYENRHCLPSYKSLRAIASTGINVHWFLTGEGNMRVLVNELGRAANTETEVHFVSVLMTIARHLQCMPDHERSAVLDQIESRVQEAKRVNDLEILVAKLEQEKGYPRK